MPSSRGTCGRCSTAAATRPDRGTSACASSSASRTRWSRRCRGSSSTTVDTRSSSACRPVRPSSATSSSPRSSSRSRWSRLCGSWPWCRLPPIFPSSTSPPSGRAWTKRSHRWWPTGASRSDGSRTGRGTTCSSRCWTDRGTCSTSSATAASTRRWVRVSSRCVTTPVPPTGCRPPTSVSSSAITTRSGWPCSTRAKEPGPTASTSSRARPRPSSGRERRRSWRCSTRSATRSPSSSARTTYAALVSGQPVDAALGEARKAAAVGFPGSYEWATPVLFLRAPDGQHLRSPAPRRRTTRRSAPRAARCFGDPEPWTLRSARRRHAKSRDDLARTTGYLLVDIRAYRCALGYGGVSLPGAKREGDGTVPGGRFPLRQVLYRPDRRPPPATRLPVRRARSRPRVV